MKPHVRRAQNQCGMTLLEVLIAVIVLAIGLLGLAGLQVSGLRHVAESGTHGHAVLLANELVERIHLNRDNAADYTSVPSNCSSPTSTKDIDYCTVLMRARGDTDGDGSTDTGEERLLREHPGTPMFTFATCGGCGTSGLYTLTISWAERGLDGSDQAVNYSLNFMP